MEKEGLAAGLSGAGVRRDDVWLLADEMRLGLHGQVRRVWAPRGVKVRQRRQIAYRWTYLALGADAVRGRLYWAWRPNMRQETLASVVAAWAAEGVAAVVWDGSGSHKGRRVRQTGMRLIGLPPYSPELNPPERVFQELRGALEGRAYDALEAKVAAAETILRELAADPERTRRLVGWSWIRAAHDALPDEITV